MTRRSLLLVLAATLLGLFGVGCGAPSLRFDAATHTAMAQAKMRRLETESLVVYYPEHARDETLRVAARYEACLHKLRGAARIHTKSADEKPRIAMPDAPLNNAYVAPTAGGVETFAVVPTYETAEIFATLGLPPDPGFVGCHELTHYVQGLQVTGVPGLVNEVFGNVITPQVGLDSWFWEGLAVYYETKLQGGVGRLGSPFWHGLFASGVAGRKPNGGWMSDFQRDQPFGANYLTGSHFIDWLARTYGEEKLWMVISHQADSIFFPLGVNPRFGNVYGKNLSGLIDEFAAFVQTKYKVEGRPDGQREVRELETTARYTCQGASGGPAGQAAGAGLEAEITSGYDAPTRLVVRDARGEVVFDENLTDVLPGRRLVVSSPILVSGLSFTRDGKYLYFSAIDQGEIQQVSRLVRVDLAAGRYEIVFPDLGGPGGSISPDGSTYYFVRARGDRYELVELDVATRTPHWLNDFGPRTYPLSPRVSPDGTRLAVTLFDGRDFKLGIYGAKDGRLVDEVARRPRAEGESPSAKTERWELDPAWLDDRHLVYASESEGRMQVFRADLDAKETTRLTSAPYLAMAPCAQGGKLRFMNRKGWSWTLDEIAIDAPAPAALAPLPVRGAPDTAYVAHDEPVTVVSDKPYSRLDHLFVPQYRTITAGTIGSFGSVAGAAIGGGDRLGFHRWSMGAEYNFKSRLVSGDVGYVTAELAPVFVALAVSHAATRETLSLAEVEDVDLTRRETTAALSIVRPFYTNSVDFGLVFDDLRRGGFDDLRAFGPQATATFAAAESTPYTGPRRLLVGTARAAWYPAEVSSRSSHTADLRGQVYAVLPIRILRRPTFAVSTRTRQLVGVSNEEGFLQVGGGGATGVFARDDVADGRDAPDDPRRIPLPPAVRFQEPLFGFEDRALYAARMAAADARLRFPIVTDIGSASSLWLLPAFFLRGFALEAFGGVATLFDRRQLPAAAGGGAVVQLSLWRIPLDLRVHVSRRITYDEKWVPYFGADTSF